jgi:hypothetical protein
MGWLQTITLSWTPNLWLKSGFQTCISRTKNAPVSTTLLFLIKCSICTRTDASNIAWGMPLYFVAWDYLGLFCQSLVNRKSKRHEHDFNWFFLMLHEDSSNDQTCWMQQSQVFVIHVNRHRPYMWRTFIYLAAVTGDRAADLEVHVCLALIAFSSECYYTCHSCCDTGPPFSRSYPKDTLYATLLAKDQSLPILTS